MKHSGERIKQPWFCASNKMTISVNIRIQKKNCWLIQTTKGEKVWNISPNKSSVSKSQSSITSISNRSNWVYFLCYSYAILILFENYTVHQNHPPKTTIVSSPSLFVTVTNEDRDWPVIIPSPTSENSYQNKVIKMTLSPISL